MDYKKFIRNAMHKVEMNSLNGNLIYDFQSIDNKWYVSYSLSFSVTEGTNSRQSFTDFVKNLANDIADSYLPIVTAKLYGDSVYRAMTVT